MTGFSAEWLALREPADAAARSIDIAATPEADPSDGHGSEARHSGARHAFPSGGEGGALDVVDLGAGSGANLRWLAPRLGPRQRWLLVDNDESLLAEAASTKSRIRSVVGRSVQIAEADSKAAEGVRDPAAAGAEALGPRSECRVRTLRLDLASGLGELRLPRRGLVTASALLDLVSHDWLRTLAARCAEAEAAVLFALTYDGRIDAAPAEPDDDTVRRLVNRHQRRDKGFGPALGPSASAAAVELFQARGYRLRSARSDWQLGPADADLQRALIDGWARAAAEIDPARRGAIDAWRTRRLEHVAAGRSVIRVGHVDFAGVPAAPRDAPAPR